MTDQELGVASAQERRPQPGQGVSHTPGPWWSEVDDGNTRHEIRAAAARYPIATVSSYWTGEPGLPTAETRAANARLMAAAPDLLDALETLAGRLCGDTMSDQDRRDAYEIADAAIAKASGQ